MAYRWICTAIISSFVIICVSLLFGISTLKPNIPVTHNVVKSFDAVDITDWSYYQSEEGFIVSRPDSWIAVNEVGVLFYSPEMYKVQRGAGLYSLTFKVHSDFNTLDDFMVSRRDCAKDILYLKFLEYTAVRYTDTCYYGSPQVYVKPYQQKIIEGISYSVSDESETILRILSSFKFKE